MKKIIVLSWLCLLLFMAGGLFWYCDWIYLQPTPVPPNYKPVNIGQLIQVGLPLKYESKPVFLHFFNPLCPCSRFNIPTVKRLYKLYGAQVNFVIVVMSNRSYTVQEIQDKFDLAIPVVFDRGLALQCGVYSTPQAVLLDARHKLYYRGNYNNSRYCTDEKTNYAKIAIIKLLSGVAPPAFSAIALKAYGCSLPGCKK